MMAIGVYIDARVTKYGEAVRGGESAGEGLPDG